MAVEVHTLLCRVRIPRYLVAVRSLTRFRAPVEIVAHDDGTLTGIDRAHRPALVAVGPA